MGSPRAALVGAALLGVLSACTVGPGTPAARPAAAPEPPPPPAACLLDAPAMAAATGVEWVPDLVAATDARCVYDAGDAFLAVDLAPGDDVEGPAALCDTGSRTDLPAGGWACRFGDGVYGAAVLADAALDDAALDDASPADDRVVTVATAVVPAGTTADRVRTALAAELERLAGS